MSRPIAAVLLVALAGTAARADVAITTDLALGGGGSLVDTTTEPAHFHYGLYAGVAYAAEALRTAHHDVPIGVFLEVDGARHGHPATALGATVTLADTGDLPRAVTLSLGALSLERADGHDHLGVLARVSGGLWGMGDWHFKAFSAALYVEYRYALADGPLPADHQLIAGVQIDPAGLVLGALLALLWRAPRIGQ